MANKKSTGKKLAPEILIPHEPLTGVKIGQDYRAQLDLLAVYIQPNGASPASTGHVITRLVDFYKSQDREFAALVEKELDKAIANLKAKEAKEETEAPVRRAVAAHGVGGGK